MAFQLPEAKARRAPEALRARLEILSRQSPLEKMIPEIPRALMSGYQIGEDISNRRSVKQARQTVAEYLALPDEQRQDPLVRERYVDASLSLGITPPELKERGIDDKRLAQDKEQFDSKQKQDRELAAERRKFEAEQKELDRKAQKEKEAAAATKTEEKPLSAEASKTVNMAESGIKALSRIRSITEAPENQGAFGAKNLAGGGGALADFAARMSGNADSQVLVDKIEEVKDVLGRLRTGAAITASEESNYARKLNQRFKDPAAAAESLKTVEDFLQGVTNDIRSGKRAAAAAAAVTPAAIKPGHEEGGFRFKGGDPAAESSWEKI